MVSPHAGLRRRARAIVAALLAGLALAWLFAQRFQGAYDHRTLANVLLLGLGWAVVSRGLGRSSRVPRPPGGRGPAEAASRSGRHERGEHR